jgi:hypothetical protein
VVHSVPSRTQTLASRGSTWKVEDSVDWFAWRRFHFVGRGRLSLSGVSFPRDEQSYFSMHSTTRLRLLFRGGYSVSRRSTWRGATIAVLVCIDQWAVYLYIGDHTKVFSSITSHLTKSMSAKTVVGVTALWRTLVARRSTWGETVLAILVDIDQWAVYLYVVDHTKVLSSITSHLMKSMPAEITLAVTTLWRTLVPIFAVGCGKAMYIAEEGLEWIRRRRPMGFRRVLRQRDLKEQFKEPR